MKRTIEVENTKEAVLIRDGLSDPTVLAFVKCMGALKTLPSDRARRRVIEFASDKFEEEQCQRS